MSGELSDHAAKSYAFGASVRLGTTKHKLSVPAVVVQPGPATGLVASGLPVPSETGAPVPVTVAADDAFGNIATGYRGTVQFTSSDPGASVPSDYTFTAADAGTHTFAGGVMFLHEGTQSVTATDTASSGITGSDSVHVNGTKWSLVPAPNPQAENGSGFGSIDCVASGQCETVGWFDYANVDQSAIAYGRNGSAWSAQQPVNPGGQFVNTLSSVSCTAATACTSVGTWTGDFPLTLAERWNGTRWTRQAFANPPKTVTSDLSGVACTGAKACVAVGSQANNENSFPSSAMTAQWNGSGWSLTPTAQPKGNNAALAAVSCPAASACVAVGASIGSSSGSETLVEVR